MKKILSFIFVFFILLVAYFVISPTLVNSIKNYVEELKLSKIYETYYTYIEPWATDNYKDINYITNFTAYEFKLCSSGDVFKLPCYIYRLNIPYYETKHLPTISEFWKEGGDCKGYSWFYYALIEVLKERGYKKMEILKYEPNKKYIIDDKILFYTYIDNTGAELIDLQSIYPIVACFDVGGSDVGHCAILLCPMPLEEIISKGLQNKTYQLCTLIEPQKYAYKYDIIEEYGDAYKYRVENEIGYIFRPFILFNKDMFCITIEKNEWHCTTKEKALKYYKSK